MNSTRGGHYEAGKAGEVRLGRQPGMASKNRSDAHRQKVKRPPPPPPKGYHPPSEWKKGQSGNPDGAPRKGQSYAEAIRTIDSLTVAEAIELVERAGGSPDLIAPMRAMPQSMPMKLLKALRVSIANICEPTTGLLNFEADRSEGKVKERLEHSGPDGRPIPAALTVVLGVPPKITKPKNTPMDGGR